ncbi:MAG: HNH endonuclease signature motif containing protein, partial [bacterium]|nr:HNH endonuclease signature motif containing protein [bacterium]
LSVRSLAEVVRRVSTPVKPVAASTVCPVPVAQEPTAAPKPSFVTIAFHAERFAVWEAWLAAARIAAPGAPTDELLAGLIDQGGAAIVIRLVIQQCPDCRSSMIATSRGDLAVTGALLARAVCEAERQGPDGSLRRAVPPRMRRLVLTRDGHRCQAEGCGRAQHLHVHHRTPIEEGGRATLDNLITLCGRCHRALHEREAALKAAAGDPAG